MVLQCFRFPFNNECFVSLKNVKMITLEVRHVFREMRRKDKAMSIEDSIQLLIRGQEGVLGTLSSDGYPYTVAVNYVYVQGKIYFHSAKEGHKIDNINGHEKVSFTVYDHVKVVGKKLTTNYESVLVFGTAKVVKASQEILLALINKYVEMSTDMALKVIDKEISDTAIVEISIAHLSGKRSL